MASVFDDVVGQDLAVERMRRAAAEGPSHAWLFTGPPGSGRSVLARAFASALLCPLGGCTTCPDCCAVSAGTHPDLELVVPHELSIRVETARRLRATMSETAMGGRWRVAIVEDVDRLTEGAAAALLKIVEEPPPRAVFLLCTPSTHPDDVPVTIQSRCQIVTLRMPPVRAVEELLRRGERVDPEMASWAAAVSQGHVGRARGMAVNAATRRSRERVLGTPSRLRTLADGVAEAAAWVAAAEQQAADLSDEIEISERDVLSQAVGAPSGRGSRRAAPVATGSSAAGGLTGSSRRARTAKQAGPSAATRREATASLSDLAERQRLRRKRQERDALDLALADLASLYRDVLLVQLEAAVTAEGPDQVLANLDVADGIAELARHGTPEESLRRIEAVLACRTALEQQAKPQIALEALMATLLAP